MKQISKSIFLDLPEEVAYQAITKNDSTRYIADIIGGWSRQFTKAIPYSQLTVDFRDNQGRFLITEYSFRKLTDQTCEVTMNFYYDHFDSTYIGPLLGHIIDSCVLLGTVYNLKVQ